MACLHRNITVKTERDGCSWVQCQDCPKKGPCKHGYFAALVAYAVASLNRHPRPKRQKAR
jgi:hypothetical protein